MFNEKNTRDFGESIYHVFKKYPRVTMWTAIIVFSFFMTFVTMNERKDERRQLDNVLRQIDASDQIKKIEGVQAALKELELYLVQRRSRIVEAEETLKKLTDEKGKIEPIVKIDRSTLDAFLTLQSEKNQGSVWLERGIGFATGVMSSIVAALILNYFAQRKEGGRSES